MATHEIFMPALSSTMTEGKIVEWLKKPGDRVERGESVLVVESDKADMDVEAFQEGFLASVLLPSGGTAPVGETIGLIVETEAEIAAVQASAPAAPAAAAPVASAEPPAPVAAAVPAPAAPAAAPVPAPAPVAAAAPAPAAVVAAGGRLVATPRARKLASQLGVALESLRGSGPHGRIQAEDVERAAGQAASLPRVAEGTAPAVAAAPAAVASANGSSATAPVGQAFGNPGDTVAFNTLQAAVNRNMLASLAVPCFHVGYTITTDRLDAFAKSVKSKGVTMTALLAKAVGVVLARHPQVNASFSEAGMVYPPAINVAVAVAMDDGGLITPVLAAADRTDLYSLSRSWADLVARSRSKQLKPEEYSTGTFTLSNLGMFGVDRFDAILPPGTGAILAVAASRPAVVAGKDGSIAVRRQMQVNLTADHRVIYGTHAAAFLKDLAQLIETAPESLAL
ncbi:2-oxo acid dehydrogenase subunit E2 [Synechococcus sp. CBW1107]|uniref:dihydrolipoamide acetyltransferase family protein n=1 Tax=Synechococcus sp. CBW1107 TaxID=2789857 RepID=UPI0018CF7CE9|nr:dihydrolipoamide acetyltransferase family protein [Synechococcus sp. CBW1107]QPN55985.1 2-oxo acid dehydrogenase subunit E2 [Synechococcus sp. CBW1107]